MQEKYDTEVNCGRGFPSKENPKSRAVYAEASSGRRV